MGRVKLIISYDGTAYRGWQDNVHAPSIERALADGLYTLLQRDVKLEAASRTDAGVHAQGQVVVFDILVDTEWHRILRSLNHVLPGDISVVSAEQVTDSFHPTLSSKGKKYRYYICSQRVQLPLYRKYSWHIADLLDIEKMENAAQDFVGEHNFKAFCNQRNDLSYDSYLRKIESISFFQSEDGRLGIDIKGENFLYKMVRNIIGTLVYIGLGKLSHDCVPQLIQERDRKKIGMTAPAHGLALMEVYY